MLQHIRYEEVSYLTSSLSVEQLMKGNRNWQVIAFLLFNLI